MRPKVQKLLKKLQLGSYMVRVDAHGRAAYLPISGGSVREFRTKILYRCGDGHRPTDLKNPGTFIVTKDPYGYVTDVLPMTAEESRAFILGVLGS